MNELQRKRLRENRVRIVSDLEPRGAVIDTLYEDGVLTENDLEFVSSAKTRKERCHALLSILPTRGPSAYGSFQRALDAGKYDFLASQFKSDIAEALPDHDRPDQSQGVLVENCHCSDFLEKMKNQKKDLNVFVGNLLSRHCCLFLDNIEAKDIIDQLFQDHVITSNDIDRIVSCSTRRDRCETLFEILLSVQDSAIAESLKLALVKKYAYIVENVSEAFHDKQTEQKTSKIQEYEEIANLQWETKELERFTSNSDLYTECTLGAVPQRKENGCSCRMSKLQEKSVKNQSNGWPCQGQIKAMNTSVRCLVHHSGASNKDVLFDDITEDFHRLNSEMNTVDGACVKTSVNQHTSERSNTCSVNAEKDTTVSLYALNGANRMEKKVNDVTHQRELLRNGKSKIRKQTATTKVQTLTGSTDEDDRHISDRNTPKRALIPKQPTSIQSEKPKRRLTVAFNYLSTLINQGDFVKFEEVSNKLRSQFSRNYDIMCIIGYLQTSRDLFQTDFDSAKRSINSTMALVPKTSNPRYFTLELFTAKTRMYITQKRLEKLQATLDEAMMILETDPVGCTGRAAGWLYINDARNKIAQMSCLNLKNSAGLKVYERLFENAKTSFLRAMTNFNRDGGKDGPFGFAYALCRLVILLLRCGDNGLTMNSLTPSLDDKQTAGQYLQHLEDSEVVISRILDMHFRLAKCDFQFRRGNCVRALEHAQVAYNLATEMRLLEFTEHAYNRISFLKPKVSAYFVADELSEEETHRILFEETTETESHSLSE